MNHSKDVKRNTYIVGSCVAELTFSRIVGILMWLWMKPVVERTIDVAGNHIMAAVDFAG
jgi:hypothetical protein